MKTDDGIFIKKKKMKTDVVLPNAATHCNNHPNKENMFQWSHLKGVQIKSKIKEEHEGMFCFIMANHLNSYLTMTRDVTSY